MSTASQRTASQRIADALFEALITASPEECNELSLSVKHYKETYHRSYEDLKRHPFLGRLLDAINEATERATS